MHKELNIELVKKHYKNITQMDSDQIPIGIVPKNLFDTMNILASKDYVLDKELAYAYYVVLNIGIKLLVDNKKIVEADAYCLFNGIDEFKKTVFERYPLLSHFSFMDVKKIVF